MGSSSHAFADLKALIQSPLEKERLAFSLFKPGLPQGGITALWGCGKTELAVQFLAEHPESQAAWIEEKLSVFPFGFLQKHIQLQRILFVESKTQTEWATLQILKSQAFPIVILYSENCEARPLRRFQLAAERSQTCFIWLTTKPPAGWMVSLSLYVQRTSTGLQTQLLKQRF